MKAINALCEVVPGLVWALLLAIALLAAGAQTERLHWSQTETTAARAAAAKWKGGFDELTTKLSDQKKEAAATLAAAIAERDAAQKALTDGRKSQETKDAKHKDEVARARADLDAAVAAGAGRLRDPWAEGPGCRSGGQDADGGPGPGAGAGAPDAAEAGGLLSAQLTERLQRREREADAVNEAYAQCRADVFLVRRLPVPADNDPR